MQELHIVPQGEVGEVQLVEWLAKDGTEVSEGAAIYTIESDKAVIEVAAPASGTLRIIESAGKVLPAGHLVGVIATETNHPTNSATPRRKSR